MPVGMTKIRSSGAVGKIVTVTVIIETEWRLEAKAPVLALPYLCALRPVF